MAISSGASRAILDDLRQCCWICDQDDEDCTGLGSHPMSGKPLQKTLCARRWTWKPCGHTTCCPAAASIPCETCNLVKYCSLHCMQRDQERHRQLCNNPLLRKEITPLQRGRNFHLLPDSPTTMVSHLPTLCNPSFPVYGLLGMVDDSYTNLISTNSSSNEDLWPSAHSWTELPDHLRFLFPCAYDLRNVLQTVCEVPNNYRGRVTIFINCARSILAARDVLILELLRCYGLNGIDIAIALWYSTALTTQQDRELLLAICRILHGNRSQNTEEKSKIGAKTTCRYQNSFPSRKGSFLRADLSSDPRGIMMSLLIDLDATFEPTDQYWERTEEMDDIKNVKLMCALPAHLASWNRYHTRGLLLPFDTMDTHFTAPNRVRYCRSLNFITRYSKDVLCGWDIQKLISSGIKYGASDDDLYGCLFFHIREMMQTFLEKLKNCRIELCLTQFSAQKLAEILQKEEIHFHRVDGCSLAHDSTVGSNHKGPTISSALDSGSVSLRPDVHALTAKLSLLGEKNFQVNPGKWMLPETLNILGRLLEKNVSKEGFQSLLLTAMLDWVTKEPLALKFLQEQERKIEARQQNVRKSYDDLHQHGIGKWAYSATLTPDENTDIQFLLDPYAKPARAMMLVDKGAKELHEKYFWPNLYRLAANEEEKSGLNLMHQHRILPRNWLGLMYWRILLAYARVRHYAANRSMEEILRREYPSQLYYTVLFGGITFLEEFQEWAVKGQL